MSEKWKEIKIKYNNIEEHELICSVINDNGIESIIYDDQNIMFYTRNEKITESIGSVLKNSGIFIESTVSDIDNSWKSKIHGDFKAVEAGDYVVLSKDYLDEYKGNLKKIIINPAQAFGSGQHATTKQCMLLIQDIIKNNNIKSFLEPGCGTSILSLLASFMGIKEIYAYDHDENSIINAQENLILNNCDYEVRCHDIIELPEKYDLVSANIFAHVLIKYKNTLLTYLKDNSFLILSGIENSQAQEVYDVFGKDLKYIKKESFDGWTTFVFQKSV